MITFDQVSITYDAHDEPTLQEVDLTIDEGELCLVIGSTGTGKSTLLGAISGLVPHFTGGLLRGRVTVDGRDTRHHPPRELADVVGVVGQDPLAGFVTDTVEEELAYAMEQLAIEPGVMRKRVEETLDLLGIADLRDRPLRDLSGGQQQRVAIGSVLTAHPRVLVLDEPTSALDPTAAEEVLAAITRLVHDLGVTVVMAEHRLERAVQYADRILALQGDGTVHDGSPTDILATSDIAPPVVHLGRLAGWSPLPLSVRDARRRAAPLREQLTGRKRPAGRRPVGATLLHGDAVVVRYGNTIAVREVSIDLAAGQVAALMGRNGSGKSSLLWALQGSGERTSGSVTVNAPGTPGDRADSPARQVGLVPQTPADLLYLATVDEELSQADAEHAVDRGTSRALLDRLVPGIEGFGHPRDLSEGQRLGLVLAIALTASPAIVLLDEPTRGLDYGAKERLSTILAELAAEGRAVLVSTHDVEFVAMAAQRVIVMAEGEVVADGPTDEVVTSSPSFAPQVAKILAPLRWLTPVEVANALAEGTDHATDEQAGTSEVAP